MIFESLSRNTSGTTVHTATMETIKDGFFKIISLFSFTTTPTPTSTPLLTTFKVSNVRCSRVSNKKATTSSICSQLRLYDKHHCTEVLMETQFPSSVRASRNNGFVNTVVECYNNHHNLVIRPDDIWTAIMTQFSFYVNANAEEFRHQFVAFEGKKELTVAIDGTLRSAPYDRFVTLMTEEISANLVDDTVKDWILPNFTTTTPDDIITCGIILMAATKKYFDVTSQLLCGIPFITLEGSVDDWENILGRLEKLKSYKLTKWYDMLEPILREFVAARKNEPNIDFWNRICHHSGRGSGPRYISGWLTAFAVFNEEGEWKDCEHYYRGFGNSKDTDCDCDTSDEEDNGYGGNKWPKVEISEIPCGTVKVNVKIIDTNGDANVEYDTLMIAGHVAYEVLEDKCSLKPRIGWGLTLKLTDEEKEKVHEVDRAKKKYFCATCNAQLIDFKSNYSK